MDVGAGAVDLAAERGWAGAWAAAMGSAAAAAADWVVQGLGSAAAAAMGSAAAAATATAVAWGLVEVGEVGKGREVAIRRRSRILPHLGS